MSDTLITTIGLIIVALIGVYGNYKIAKMNRQLDTVHEQVNGMKAELVKTTKELGRAEGKVEGIAEQKAEDRKQ